MKEITITKKLKVFSRDDIQEAIQYIQEEGYFANNISEFEDTISMFTLNNINITNPEDINVFSCDDGEYSLFAVIVNE